MWTILAIHSLVWENKPSTMYVVDDDDDEQHLYGAIYLFQITFKGASSSNKIRIKLE